MPVVKFFLLLIQPLAQVYSPQPSERCIPDGITYSVGPRSSSPFCQTNWGAGELPQLNLEYYGDKDTDCSPEYNLETNAPRYMRIQIGSKDQLIYTTFSNSDLLQYLLYFLAEPLSTLLPAALLSSLLNY